MFRKILLFAFILTCAEASFATRARLLSLQGGDLYNGAFFADHVIDEQSVFFYPARVHQLQPSVMFEMGAPGTDAEGGILKKVGSDGRLFAYMGRDFVRTDILGTDIRNGYLSQNNPLDVIYGKDDWAFGATLSMVDNKQSKTKEQTLVLRFGKTLAAAEFFASVDLISSAEKPSGATTDKVNGSPYLQVGGNIKSGDYHIHGQFHYGDAKIEPGAGGSQKIKDQNILVGIEDRSMKASGSDLYYGTSLIIAERKYDAGKVSGTVMPIYIGVEYDVNSWAVLRGSVRQNFLLIGSTKNETTTPAQDAEGIASNTTVATGLGFKYNKLQLDGTLAASTTGAINGSAVLAQAGLVYYY